VVRAVGRGCSVYISVGFSLLRAWCVSWCAGWPEMGSLCGSNVHSAADLGMSRGAIRVRFV
jgi:hypothetical protein